MVAALAAALGLAVFVAVVFFRQRTRALGRLDAEVAARREAEARARDQEAHYQTLLDQQAHAEAQRRDVEQRLELVQRLESLGLLAAGIAHGFNNRLASIATAAALVRERSSDPETRAHAADITRSVELAHELVRKLLAFGRQQPGQASEVEPLGAILKMLPALERIVRATPECRLVHVDEGCAGPIRIDPVLFEQSIANLVANARDAMAKGGTIRLHTSVRIVPADEAQLHRVRPGPFVVIAVIDEGHGLDTDTRLRMFDPFFTTRATAGGLGLTVVHATVEKAHGFITVDSSPGAGASFRVHLPIVRPGEADPEPPRPAARPTPPATLAPATPTTILLCDDDDLLRRAARRMLELRGYRVVDAGAPERALDLFGMNPDGFDLLLSDVVMPVMSGPELVRRVRAIRPALPVVLMSGHTRDVMVDAQNADAAELPFVQKPFTVDTLAVLVRGTLDRTRPPAA